MNFFDSVIECSEYIDSAEKDENIQKQDVIDGIRSRLSVMVGRIVGGQPMDLTGNCVARWKVEDAES